MQQNSSGEPKNNINMDFYILGSLLVYHHKVFAIFPPTCIFLIDMHLLFPWGKNMGKFINPLTKLFK